jgi:putative transposase
MKRARFSEEQIIAILKEAEAGAKVTELCRKHGISDATFYTWRSKYGGLEVSEMRRLRLYRVNHFCRSRQLFLPVSRQD